MLNAFLGFALALFFLYLLVVVAYWYDAEEIGCWYCRILKALAWPYELYKGMRD